MFFLLLYLCTLVLKILDEEELIFSSIPLWYFLFQIKKQTNFASSRPSYLANTAVKQNQISSCIHCTSIHLSHIFSYRINLRLMLNIFLAIINRSICDSSFFKRMDVLITNLHCTWIILSFIHSHQWFVHTTAQHIHPNVAD